MNDEKIINILEQMLDILHMQNTILKFLLEDSIRNDEKQGIFKEMDDDINRFFNEWIKGDGEMVG